MRPEASSAVLDFSRRASEPELMDQPCSYQDFRQCLVDLAQINFVTLGYRPTLTWLRRLNLNPDRRVHLVDVGCGGGDMLRHIERWGRRRSLQLRLTGIDLNPFAERAARERALPGESIHWVTGDAFSYQPPEPIDIVVSSLFTHHLPSPELVEFLRWMEQHARVGWFVNDLHREVVPFHLIRLLARLFRWHRFVHHDAPLSVRRSFSPEDWKCLSASAGLPLSAVKIETFRPGRLCVGRQK